MVNRADIVLVLVRKSRATQSRSRRQATAGVIPSGLGPSTLLRINSARNLRPRDTYRKITDPAKREIPRKRGSE